MLPLVRGIASALSVFCWIASALLLLCGSVLPCSNPPSIAPCRALMELITQQVAFRK